MKPPIRIETCAYFEFKKDALAYQNQIAAKQETAAELSYDRKIGLFKVKANQTTVPPAVYTPKPSARTISKADVTRVLGGTPRIGSSSAGRVTNSAKPSHKLSLNDISTCSICKRVGPLQSQRCSICLSKPYGTK